MRTALLASILVVSTEGFVPLVTRHDITSTKPSSQLHAFDLSHVIQQGISAFQGASPITDSNVASDMVVDSMSTTISDPNSVSLNSGGLGFLAGPILGLLQIIHSALVGAGVSSNAWGISIILMTIIIKALVFPLMKSQLESAGKLRQVQPLVKEIQAQYQSTKPDLMNEKLAEFYQANNISPLAGFLPSLLQVPVLIGLYRAVLGLTKRGMIDEPFLWIPSLEGPTYGADAKMATDWIRKGWYVVSCMAWTIFFLCYMCFDQTNCLTFSLLV